MDSIEELLSNTLIAAQWNHIGIRNHHGIDLPLSALHTKNSCGIGEFYDLFPLIDWCHELKLDVIQLLPLNDSGDDPSPYYALSSLALNPLFLSLNQLPRLEKFPDLIKKLEPIQQMTRSQRIQYQDVQSHKFFWLREYYELVGSSLLKSKGFQEFVSQNPWVEFYGLFKTIKSSISKNDWRTWPKELKEPSKKELQSLIKMHLNDVQFHILLQYLCFLQLTAVKNQAKEKNILLKGDIPILISPDSADVWQNPDQFDLSLSAGAPPDFYTPEGQVWGFPLFNWEIMKTTDYGWWKQRLAYASHFFDLYRIDHVLGFFRIWGIPLGRPSKEGKFIPEDEGVWENHGKELLLMLEKNSPMLPIAEDLGVVPDMVRKVLSEIGICGTKVMRWERMWKEDQRFIPIQQYNPLSMTTVSTHDSPTLQLWWRDLPEEAKTFARYKHWDYTPTLSKNQRQEILWESHHTSSLFHINLLQEYLALFPELVWQNPEDERINIPGKVLSTNWTYRFRPSVEEIVSHGGLNDEINKILTSATPPSMPLGPK